MAQWLQEMDEIIEERAKSLEWQKKQMPHERFKEYLFSNAHGLAPFLDPIRQILAHNTGLEERARRAGFHNVFDFVIETVPVVASRVRLIRFLDENIDILERREQEAYRSFSAIDIDTLGRAIEESCSGQERKKSLLTQDELDDFERISPVLMCRVPQTNPEILGRRDEGLRSPDPKSVLVTEYFLPVGPGRVAVRNGQDRHGENFESWTYSFYVGLNSHKISADVLVSDGGEEPTVLEWKRAVCIELARVAKATDKQEFDNRVTKQMFQQLTADEIVLDADDITAWLEAPGVVLVPSHRWLDIFDDEAGEFLTDDTTTLDTSTSDRYRVVVKPIPTRVLHKDSLAVDWCDRAKVLRTVEAKLLPHHPHLYHLIGDNLKSDKELLLAALEHRPDNAYATWNQANATAAFGVGLHPAHWQPGHVNPLKFADESLRRDRNVAETAIKCSTDAFLYLPPALRADKELALLALQGAAVAASGVVYDAIHGGIPTALRSDKAFVLDVLRVEQGPSRYSIVVPEDLRADKDILCAIVSKSPDFLYGGSGGADPSSFRRNWTSLAYPEEERLLHHDRDIVLCALRSRSTVLSRWQIPHPADVPDRLPRELFGDRDFALAAVEVIVLVCFFVD